MKARGSVVAGMSNPFNSGSPFLELYSRSVEEDLSEYVFHYIS